MRKAALLLCLVAFPASASLEVDGVWEGGIWAPTVWADDVWREGDPPAEGTDDAMPTTFISGAVPDTAVFLAGSAYTSGGDRYVAECTTPDAFLAGIGHRNDGATCIDPGATIDAERGGWALTDIGEVVSAECSPEYWVNGIPRDEEGPVCMTEID